ncbi:hypothetical protein GY45DRAFT_1341281 [Cubamyces sp. BRFM 1775]|nr:hypothetical protein GY45DRAFT_1341281 [Cubamyces sp. BRFM 1775]
MSAAMLTENSKVVEIADELESFFHVILYNAIRYLSSNCTHVGAFIEDFFDTYKEEDGQLFCGDRKEAALKDKGRILLSSNVPLRFNTPIDRFMDTVLKWFKARYTIYTYRTWQIEGHAQRSKVTQPVVISSEESEPVTQLWDTLLCDASASEDPDIDPFLYAELEDLEPTIPTEDEEKIASLVDTHTAFLKGLSMAVGATGWKNDSVKGDNVPASYKPRRRVGPLRHAGLATLRRRRTGVQTWSPPSDDWEDSLPTPTPSRTHTAGI